MCDQCYKQPVCIYWRLQAQIHHDEAGYVIPDCIFSRSTRQAAALAQTVEHE